MQEHRRDQEIKAAFALIVTSDTRTEETDETGKAAIRLLEEAGHTVPAYLIVPNDAEEIREAVSGILEDDEVRVLITSGGTGVSPRDRTVDTVAELLERRLPGFGEHFRRLSYDEIGVPSIMSRALAGTAMGKLVFCLPGSRGAMRTALNEIILPGIGHWLWEMSRE